MSSRGGTASIHAAISISPSFICDTFGENFIELCQIESIFLQLILDVLNSCSRHLHLLLILYLFIELLSCRRPRATTCCSTSICCRFWLLASSLGLVQSWAGRTNASRSVRRQLIGFAAFSILSRIAVAAGIVGLVDLTLGAISMILHQLITQIYQYIFGSLRVWARSSAPATSDRAGWG